MTGRSVLEGRKSCSTTGEKAMFRGNFIVLYNDPQHVWGQYANFGHMSVGYFRTLETSTQSNTSEAEAQIGVTPG